MVVLAGLLVLAAVLAAAVAWLNLRGERGAQAYGAGGGAAQALPQDRAALVERGAYLARVGNCAGCHTAAGGAEYAGGRALQTGFGTLYTSNLTPDADTGLGLWSAADFWRALHNGRSRDGRLLYPAFPYDSYTHVSQADSDALFAYLQSLAPVRASVPEHALGLPYRTQGALAIWRALYFRPQVWQDEAGRTPEYNRGAYLARGLGHCAACHAPRNALGASSVALSGGLVAGQAWYAPSLLDAAEAGVAPGAEQAWVRLLATGAGAAGVALGPMVEVVARSTQYWQAQDLQALAIYLREQGQAAQGARRGAPPSVPAATPQLALGRKLYGQQCAACHGREGQGVEGAFPALAGNVSVNLTDPRNLLLAVLEGGYGAATGPRPRPHGMPPFGHVLTDAQVAAVATYVRSAWGNRAPEVGNMEVYRAREGRGF
jgi:mono/diheme cytochrome c family protein